MLSHTVHALYLVLNEPVKTISLHSPGRELVMKDGVARGITALHALQRFQLEKIKKVLQNSKINMVNQQKKTLIVTSVADPGWLSGIRFFPSRIQGGQDPRSRVDKIPDPGLTRSRIPDPIFPYVPDPRSDFFHTGSRIQGWQDPGSGSASKVFLTQKTDSKVLRCSSRIHPRSGSRIQLPKNNGSRIRNRKTDCHVTKDPPSLPVALCCTTHGGIDRIKPELNAFLKFNLFRREPTFEPKASHCLYRYTA